MIAIDSNLLVYAHRAGTAQHLSARAAIERAAADRGGWGVAVATVSEFWSVVTHPRTPGPSTPETARAFIEALVRTAGMAVWSPGLGFGRRLTTAAASLGVTGPRVFDLQIALTAVEAGAMELWTNDRGFVAPAGLRVVHPLDG